MRLAVDKLRQALIREPVYQDILETAAMAGGSALYQGLFTDMSPGEIAASTAIGAGLGMGGRYVGARAGRAIGKHIDKVAPTAFDEFKPYVAVTRDGSAAALNMMRKNTSGSNNEAARAFRDVLAAKRNMAGADAGTAEAILSYVLRNRADNIAQGGYALVSPLFTGGEDNA